jgi:hypothetical protein
LRLLKASEDNLDDLLRELKMAAIAAVHGTTPGASTSDGPAGARRDAARDELARLAQLAEIVRVRLGGLRVQVREGIWEASRRGDGVVDLDLQVDPGTPAAFQVLEEFLAGAGAAARCGYLLTEPPGGEVVAFRLWALEEIADQIAGEPATSCPFPVAAN